MRRVDRLAHGLVAILAAVVLTVLIGIWVARLGHPHDLEWMEGGQLAHAWRLARGLPLYPPAGPDWVPYVYPPGQPALLALLGGPDGLTYPLGRSLSLAGTGLAALAVVAMVWRAGRGPWRLAMGGAAAVVFLGTYADTGAFLDLVRPDALALGGLAWAIVLGTDRRPSAQVAGGLLLAVAFLVKHHVAAFGLPLAIGLWIRDRHTLGALRFGLSAAIPAGLATAALQVQAPLLLTYLVDVPRSHGIVAGRMLGWAPWEWAMALPVALLALGAAPLLRFVPPRSTPSTGPTPRALRVWAPQLLVLATAAVVCAVMRGHVGGFVNVHLPMTLVLAAGLGLVATHLPTTWVGPLALGAQLSWSLLRLDAAALVPTEADRRAADRVVEAIGAVDGPVWVPTSPWLSVRAGKAPGPHLIGVWDACRYDDGPFAGCDAAVQQALDEGRWAAVVLPIRDVGLDPSRGYRLHTRWRWPGKTLRPLTGYRERPARLWRRRSSSASPPLQRGGADHGRSADGGIRP